jgi:beta-glucuronidase
MNRRLIVGALAAALVLAAVVATAGATAPYSPYGFPPYAPPASSPPDYVQPASAPSVPIAGATPPTKGAEYTDGQSGRWLLGGQWLYRPDPTNAGVADGFWRDTAATTGWTGITVPNADNLGNFTSAGMTGGVGWYRRDFTLPATAFAGYVPKADQRWIIRFESVNHTATVWLNGRKLGSHAGAYLPFEFDLKSLRGGVNRLVVRVDSVRTGGDFPPGPSGGWWNYGGILREVYLRAVQRADIRLVQVRPVLNAAMSSATIEEQAAVRNPTGASQTVTLRGVYGGKRLSFGTHTIAPGASWTATATATLAHPHLWAPGSPYLYTATLRLRDAKGRALQTYTDLSGVRTIKVVDGHMQLNGRPLDLRGVNIHEQTLDSGAALSPDQEDQEIGWASQLGADVIRAHYPLAPEQLEDADRDGILIWDEIPVYQVNQSYLGQPAWQSRALALLKTNIQDNQNHPSVMLWSIGNELPTPATYGEASYIKVATAEAHQLDPTRPVGLAVSSWPGVQCQTSAYAPLDVIGDNEYFGWFDAGGGTNDDRDALNPYLDFFHNCYAKKAIFITEFGFEGSRSGDPEVRGTYDFQANSLAFHLGVFATKPWLSGAMYFAMQDFAARPGYSGGDPVAHPPFVEKGVINLYGQQKPAWGVMSQIYHGTVQVAAHR